VLLKPGRIPSVLPETQTYLNALLVNGGSISQESLQAIDRFVRDCYNANIWNKLLEVYPIAGNNLLAAMVKLKHMGNVFLSGVNLFTLDYTERGANGGIVGDGATKYINANFLQNQIPATAHMSCYLRTTGAGGVSYFMGASTATDFATIATPVGTDQRTLLGGSAVAASMASNNAGFVYADRSSSTLLELQNNNGPAVNATGATVPSYGAINIYLLARNANGVVTTWTTARCSFFSIGITMNAIERAAFYNAVQNLQINFQRNV
jgi:hypothetical protein